MSTVNSGNKQDPLSDPNFRPTGYEHHKTGPIPTDPLSDEAFYEHYYPIPEHQISPIAVWQAARRRARAMHEADLNQNDELFLENKRLRELVEEVSQRLAAHCMVIPDAIAREMLARAALEGK